MEFLTNGGDASVWVTIDLVTGTVSAMFDGWTPLVNFVSRDPPGHLVEASAGTIANDAIYFYDSDVDSDYVDKATVGATDLHYSCKCHTYVDGMASIGHSIASGT